MLITYDTLLHVAPEEFGEKTDLVLGRAGQIVVILSTGDFLIEHRGGVASVSLQRHLTRLQARELAKAMIAAADALDAAEKEFTIVTTGVRT